MNLPDVDVDACRARQQRLLQWMQEEQIDLTVVTQIEHVQYLTGVRFGWTFSPAAALRADGQMILVAPERKVPEVHAADELVGYEAQWHSTMRNDQRAESTRILVQTLPRLKAYRRLGVEYSSFPRHFPVPDQIALVDVEPHLYRMRRRKDPDELKRLQTAIAATGQMYERARQIIRPGISELEVFNQLQSVAVESLGEMMTGTGNDYRCGARGGPPRDRLIEAGELYILDLGPAYRGYFADNARTVAVTEPTDAQGAAWRAIVEVFELVERTVRPGVRCQELFTQVQEMLDRSSVGVFNHHLGHGIGLFPHEAPHLNPHWDDTFELGDVFTAEPGLYGPELNAGIRLENDYLVTENGVQCLTPFPLELKL